jgi:hypothetical protein
MERDVRYWPKADIPSCTHMSAFDKADMAIAQWPAQTNSSRP